MIEIDSWRHLSFFLGGEKGEIIPDVFGGLKCLKVENGANGIPDLSWKSRHVHTYFFPIFRHDFYDCKQTGQTAATN